MQKRQGNHYRQGAEEAFNVRNTFGRREFVKGLTTVGLVASGSLLTTTSVHAGDVRSRIANLSAKSALRALRVGEFSAVRYAITLLIRARQLNFLNALISQDTRAVVLAALRADRQRRRSADLGPLHGLPILIKDNINTTELPTSGGTPILKENFPPANAQIVDKLLNAGAILFGKSNLHELALGITSNNAEFGPVRNPYNTDLIAGGSSGGNGAAVAARMVAASIGTDTGGSTRIPAALCGIVGMRPTVGRYPGTGGDTLTEVVPISHTRDTPGPMARTVSDVALLDGIIADDPLSIEPESLSGLRLGVARNTFFGIPGAGIDPGVSDVVESVLSELAKRGVELVEADPPGLLESLQQISPVISLFEGLNIDLPAYLAVNTPGIDVNELIAHIASPDVKAIYEGIAPTIPGSLYLSALAGRTAVQKIYADFFTEHVVDALIFPTTVLPARPIGQDQTVQLNGIPVPTLTAYAINTDPAGAVGLPGLSVPAGLTPEGLPVGIELDGPAGSDRRLLSIGLAVEAAIEDAFGPLPPPPLIRRENG